VIIDDIKECSKCGVCRTVCPVFVEVKHEAMSPRGRISLIEAMLENGLSLSERYIDTIRTCIKCTRCADVCPSGVKPDKIIQSVREILYESIGVPKHVKDAFYQVIHPDRFREYLNNKKPNDANNKIPLWQLPLLFHGEAYLPKLAQKTVLESYPEYIKNGKLKIALFLGCSINYSNTAIADSVIDVLKKLGVSIFIPKDQSCCGAPMLFYGDKETAVELAKHNIESLKYDDFDAVVTLCPVCGITLKQEYERINDSDIKGFCSKIFDISEYIDKFTDYRTKKNDISVTYHDPCYLRLGQKVSSEPRKILKSITNYIEMKDASKCCGLGGTLGLLHPEISMKIGEKKVKSIIQSGADVVATGCPGCILFINDQLARQSINKEVFHTIQVLQRSLD
jgi:glycolate oxidase iron-sulfur subunit